MDYRKIEEEDQNIIENTIVSVRAIWKYRVMVILVSLLGFGIGILLCLVGINKTVYTAETTIISAPYEMSTDTDRVLSIMNRYSGILGSAKVCERAAKNLTEYQLSAKDLEEMVKKKWIRLTNAGTDGGAYGYGLVLQVEADSKSEAIPIANAMAASYARELSDMIGSDAIQVLDKAVEVKSGFAIHPVLCIGGLTGGAFAVSCLCIFMMTFCSPWVKSIEQCEQDEELILGILPDTRQKY